MKLQKHFLIQCFSVLTLVGLLLAACTPGSTVSTVTPTQSSPEQTTPVRTPATERTEANTPTAPLPPAQTSQPVDTLPPAVMTAQDDLAKTLGITTDMINSVSVEPVEWPNGCLGVESPGTMCTQVITPGYRVVFEVNGQQYEYHTNESGSVVVPVTGALPTPAGQLLVWEHTENGVCSRVEIEGTAVSYGLCGGTLQESELSASRAEELSYLTATYKPFAANTKAGKVEFNGLGQKEPTDAEKRSVAEWARLVNMEAQAGRSSAAWGLAFSWHREGGIAGFCDDMGVYLTGWAMPESCKSNQTQAVQPLNSYRLSADELAQMYIWIDQFSNFDYEQKDSATADAMLVKLAFQGQGEEQATTAQKEEIAGFAAQIYANAMTGS